MIISFSGLDGAGKTTQIRKLLGFYTSKGRTVGSIYSILPDIRYSSTKQLHEIYQDLKLYDVVHMRFRLNSNNNYAIMQKLEYMPLPQPELAFLSAQQGYNDYLELYESVICKLLQEDKTIIFDRYYYDELAFKQIYGCPLSVLQVLYTHVQKPNFAFYLRVSPEICYKRNQLRPDGKTTIYSSFDLIKKLHDYFQQIAVEEFMTVIDSDYRPNEVHNEIMNFIQDNPELSS